MFTSITSGAKALGLRFSVVGLLPTVLLTLYLFALAAVGTASGGDSLFRVIAGAAEQAGPTGLVLLLALSLVAAVVLEPFQIGVVRLVEGYWGAGSRSGVLREIGVERQRRHRHLIRLKREDANFAQRDAELGYYDQLLLRFPDGDTLLPTALGNALRAGEESAGERYGLSTTLSWPRLYYCLGEETQRDVKDLNQQIDGGARLTVVLTLAGAAGAPVLLAHGWWNLVWLLALILAGVSYRGTITAARLLRSVLETAYDLKRFDMMRQMHLPLPPDHKTERNANRRLSAFWEHEKKSPLAKGAHYEHHPDEPTAGDGPVATTPAGS